MNTLQDNLRHLLHNAKISENELARRTGISQQIINRILSGENTNPKIATLKPLAAYFMVSVSALIGDMYTTHPAIREVPLLELDKQFSSKKAPFKDKILVHIDKHIDELFAIKIEDNSMEPKFAPNTLLIFKDSENFRDKDFVLMQSMSAHYCRQLFIKDGKFYKKSLNPLHQEYDPQLLQNEEKIIGLLIQSLTDYAIP